MVPKQLGLWPSIPHHGHHGSVSPSGGAVAELSFVQLFRLVGWVGDGDDVMDRVAIQCKGGGHLPVGSLFMSQLLLLAAPIPAIELFRTRMLFLPGGCSNCTFSSSFFLGKDGYPTSSWFFLETILDVLAKRISI